MFSFSNIAKHYKARLILDNISLSFPSRTISALVGTNGAGKSTLLKIACGLVKAEEGQVKLQDLDLSSLPVHKRIGAGFGDVGAEDFRGNYMHTDDSNDCRLTPACQATVNSASKIIYHLCDGGQGDSGGPIVDYNTGALMAILQGKTVMPSIPLTANTATTLSSILENIYSIINANRSEKPEPQPPPVPPPIPP